MKIRCAQFVLGIVTSTSLFAGLHEEAVTHTPWPVKELAIVELIHSYSIQIDSREDLREFLSHSRWMKIGSLSIRFERESRHNIQSEDVQRISLLLKLAAPHLERLILNLRSTGLKTSELENLTAVLREKDFPYLREFTIDIGKLPPISVVEIITRSAKRHPSLPKRSIIWHPLPMRFLAWMRPSASAT